MEVRDVLQGHHNRVLSTLGAPEIKTDSACHVHRTRLCDHDPVSHYQA